MINSAIKVFALNGYDKASTDVIIKEAAISKGLLFHYFGSKCNLYKFVSEYCVRYLEMEMATGISESEKNLFDRVILAEKVKLKMLEQYPYADLFIISMGAEGAADARDIGKKWYAKAISDYRKIVTEGADEALLRGALSKNTAMDIVQLCMEGYKARAYGLGGQPVKVLEGLMPYIKVLKMNFTR